MYSNNIWSDQEFEIMKVVDVFLVKPTIMKKAEGLFIELKNSLVNEISQLNLTLPPETDVIKGQIARGENYKGFPFISLDMPQKFSKTEMFTYRTVFWWGHYLIFSFILKGGFVPLYCQNLIARKTQIDDQMIFLATSSNLFEWELNKENYRPVKELSDVDIEKIVYEKRFIKLASFYSVSDPNFKKLDWIVEGMKSFRSIVQMALIN